MHDKFVQTRKTNLSEIEAKLDARANWIGGRSSNVCQPLQKLILEGLDRAPRVVLPGEIITLGRSDECDIAITTDNRLSRLHCTIECNSLEGLLRDSQSTNGTYLNGQRIELARLMDKDRILIGATVLVVRVLVDSNKRSGS